MKVILNNDNEDICGWRIWNEQTILMWNGGYLAWTGGDTQGDKWERVTAHLFSIILRWIKLFSIIERQEIYQEINLALSFCNIFQKNKMNYF